MDDHADASGVEMAHGYVCDDCPPGRTFTREQVIRIGDKHYCFDHIGGHVQDVPIQ